MGKVIPLINLIIAIDLVTNKEIFFNDFWCFKIQICKNNGRCFGKWEPLTVQGDFKGRASNSVCLYQDKYIVIIGGEKLYNNKGSLMTSM